MPIVVKVAASVLAVCLQGLRCGFSVLACISLGVEGLAIEVTSVAVAIPSARCVSIGPPMTFQTYLGKPTILSWSRQRSKTIRETVCTANNPAALWVTKEIANDPSHGYTKIVPPSRVSRRH
jgi:hypothetical protein